MQVVINGRCRPITYNRVIQRLHTSSATQSVRAERIWPKTARSGSLILNRTIIRAPSSGTRLLADPAKVFIHHEEELMESAQLIQAAASIVGAMAATQYGKFGGMEASRIMDIATIAVRIARAIEIEVLKQPSGLRARLDP